MSLNFIERAQILVKLESGVWFGSGQHRGLGFGGGGGRWFTRISKYFILYIIFCYLCN